MLGDPQLVSSSQAFQAPAAPPGPAAGKLGHDRQPALSTAWDWGAATYGARRRSKRRRLPGMRSPAVPRQIAECGRGGLSSARYRAPRHRTPPVTAQRSTAAASRRRTRGRSGTGRYALSLRVRPSLHPRDRLASAHGEEHRVAALAVAPWGGSCVGTCRPFTRSTRLRCRVPEHDARPRARAGRSAGGPAETGVTGADDRFVPIDAEFGEDVRDVIADRLFAHVELGGDVGVPHAASD